MAGRCCGCRSRSDRVGWRRRSRYQAAERSGRGMTIGIVGAGALGSAIASVLARSGIDATIVNRRGPKALEPLAASLSPHVRVAPRAEVLKADIVFVAVPWGRLEEA